MPPEGHYERRRADQDRIISEYLEFMRKKDKEAKKEIVVLQHGEAFGISIALNLN
jgi:hypothetical protein